jgi:hypothetical protein
MLREVLTAFKSDSVSARRRSAAEQGSLAQVAPGTRLLPGQSIRTAFAVHIVEHDRVKKETTP